MRKLGDQWIEIIDGQEHIVKAVVGSCERCDVSHTCNVGSSCPMISRLVAKDLGILRHGLLPCPFCGEYPSLIKPEYGYQRLERPSRNGYAYECGCGVICGWDYDYGGTHQTEQEAKDAWNRRA